MAKEYASMDKEARSEYQEHDNNIKVLTACPAVTLPMIKGGLQLSRL